MVFPPKIIMLIQYINKMNFLTGSLQEKAALTIKIGNIELSQLNKGLVQLEGQYNSEQQTVT